MEVVDHVDKNPLGKQALLDAAALLIAERGVEGVSDGDIVRASGHRNRSAVLYHFGGKGPLIRALAERAVVPADLRRVELLDALEARSPEPALREVLTITIAPMGEALEDAEGRQRLRLLGQLAGHPRYRLEIGGLLTSIDGFRRCTAHMIRYMAMVPAAMLEERIALMSAFALRSYADQALRIDAVEPGHAPLTPREFTSVMTDLLVGMATAPVTIDDQTSSRS